MRKSGDPQAIYALVQVQNPRIGERAGPQENGPIPHSIAPFLP
jgi:hypothetical protein